MPIDSDQSYRQGLFFYNTIERIFWSLTVTGRQALWISRPSRSAKKNWANQGQIIKTPSDEQKVTHVSDEVHAHIYLSIFVSYLPLLDSIKRKRDGDQL
ncbi:hypothetical protein G5I_04952 [Acromyrmex echinatior]|uniref:Uncharacterized protein n=1 Tax=Acromyrmex echinatior TaxID=103372 RepID=F4WH00_ACREC|nr:hypothetical protein G5I_04952 [Acromyrmex echinatior]